jgi:hypothetical protein
VGSGIWRRPDCPAMYLADAAVAWYIARAAKR